MTVDDLAEYGVDRMSDEEIRSFLDTHGVGVLSLPTGGAPSMRPLSYWFDGEAALYLLYVVGSASQKEELSVEAEAARFLVYSVESAFSWRSVLLTGTIDPVDTDPEVQTMLESAQRPDLFTRAIESEQTHVYRFDITEQSGIRHSGLPPAFERDPSGE